MHRAHHQKALLHRTCFASRAKKHSHAGMPLPMRNSTDRLSSHNSSQDILDYTPYYVTSAAHGNNVGYERYLHNQVQKCKTAQRRSLIQSALAFAGGVASVIVPSGIELECMCFASAVMFPPSVVAYSMAREETVCTQEKLADMHASRHNGNHPHMHTGGRQLRMPSSNTRNAHTEQY